MILLVAGLLLVSLIFNYILYKQKNQIFEKSETHLKEVLLPAWEALSKTGKARVLERIHFHLRSKEVLDVSGYKELVELADDKLNSSFVSLVDCYLQEGRGNATVIWASVWLTDEISHRLNSSIRMEKVKEMAPSLGNTDEILEGMLISEIPASHLVDGVNDEKLKTLLRLLT